MRPLSRYHAQAWGTGACSHGGPLLLPKARWGMHCPCFAYEETEAPGAQEAYLDHSAVCLHPSLWAHWDSEFQRVSELRAMRAGSWAPFLRRLSLRSSRGAGRRRAGLQASVCFLFPL